MLRHQPYERLMYTNRRSARRYQQAALPPIPGPNGSSVFVLGSRPTSRAEAELAHPSHVVLYPERARQLPAVHEPVHAGSLVIAREAREAGEPAFDGHKEQENHANPATGVCRAES